jgi:hypothetical protein
MPERLENGGGSQPTPPSITTQPAEPDHLAWSDATFTVGASGTAPLHYQWRFNGADISGATTSSYTRHNVEPSHAGLYSIFVWNSAGGATSASAALTVTAPDTDADGLQDWWELKHFGNLTQIGTGDYDSDGSVNYDEYINLTTRIRSLSRRPSQRTARAL